MKITFIFPRQVNPSLVPKIQITHVALRDSARAGSSSIWLPLDPKPAAFNGPRSRPIWILYVALSHYSTLEFRRTDRPLHPEFLSHDSQYKFAVLLLAVLRRDHTLVIISPAFPRVAVESIGHASVRDLSQSALPKNTIFVSRLRTGCRALTGATIAG